jgi:Leucine-rich repeat (LRR) protein
VQVLSLKGNGIKQFPATCYNGTSLFPELQSLDLSHNSISVGISVNAFAGLTADQP